MSAICCRPGPAVLLNLLLIRTDFSVKLEECFGRLTYNSATFTYALCVLTENLRSVQNKDRILFNFDSAINKDDNV